MIEAVAVVVPAKNEENCIGACIAALEVARAQAADRAETFLVLVLDSCSDGTRAAAANWLEHPHQVLEVDFSNVGKARAHGMDYALRHFAQRDRRHVWLATTDADSRVPDSWLADHIEAADQGADALAGTVRVDDWQGYSNSQVQAYLRFYLADESAPSHPHVHGANLGIRADAYLQVGGFSDLPTGEDHALWNALQARGKRLVAARNVEVITSSRMHARAPDGFAGFLAEHCRRVT
jgi:glycosyltransferase involved in cell wall biosynthesis